MLLLGYLSISTGSVCRLFSQLRLELLSVDDGLMFSGVISPCFVNFGSIIPSDYTKFNHGDVPVESRQRRDAKVRRKKQKKNIYIYIYVCF